MCTIENRITLTYWEYWLEEERGYVWWLWIKLDGWIKSPHRWVRFIATWRCDSLIDRFRTKSCHILIFVNEIFYCLDKMCQRRIQTVCISQKFQHISLKCVSAKRLNTHNRFRLISTCFLDYFIQETTIF